MLDERNIDNKRMKIAPSGKSDAFDTDHYVGGPDSIEWKHSFSIQPERQSSAATLLEPVYPSRQLNYQEGHAESPMSATLVKKCSKFISRFVKLGKHEEGNLHRFKSAPFRESLDFSCRGSIGEVCPIASLEPEIQHSASKHSAGYLDKLRKFPGLRRLCREFIHKRSQKTISGMFSGSGKGEACTPQKLDRSNCSASIPSSSGSSPTTLETLLEFLKASENILLINGCRGEKRGGREARQTGQCVHNVTKGTFSEEVPENQIIRMPVRSRKTVLNEYIVPLKNPGSKNIIPNLDPNEEEVEFYQADLPKHFHIHTEGDGRLDRTHRNPQESGRESMNILPKDMCQSRTSNRDPNPGKSFLSFAEDEEIEQEEATQDTPIPLRDPDDPTSGPPVTGAAVYLLQDSSDQTTSHAMAEAKETSFSPAHTHDNLEVTSSQWWDEERSSAMITEPIELGQNENMLDSGRPVLALLQTPYVHSRHIGVTHSLNSLQSSAYTPSSLSQTWSPCPSGFIRLHNSASAVESLASTLRNLPTLHLREYDSHLGWGNPEEERQVYSSVNMHRRMPERYPDETVSNNGLSRSEKGVQTSGTFLGNDTYVLDHSPTPSTHMYHGSENNPRDRKYIMSPIPSTSSEPWRSQIFETPRYSATSPSVYNSDPITPRMGAYTYNYPQIKHVSTSLSDSDAYTLNSRVEPDKCNDKAASRDDTPRKQAGKKTWRTVKFLLKGVKENLNQRLAKLRPHRDTHRSNSKFKLETFETVEYINRLGSPGGIDTMWGQGFDHPQSLCKHLDEMRRAQTEVERLSSVVRRQAEEIVTLRTESPPPYSQAAAGNIDNCGDVGVDVGRPQDISNSNSNSNKVYYIRSQ
ncbi:hypothetical protein BDN70DRAFT_899878 [Pholiota conissans]|uniref:Uncharacterized protein n=1 Tax=Pholiota conissans TaxID=109636 RepID=A0A9P5YT58_9AGAR|nr:hypothetical protein BDN70DRAFT_899878 [Pholiota conissans]